MSKTVEEWKDIQGYEGFYEVSDWGNVRSTKQILKKTKNAQGYLVVSLSDKEHKQHQCKVHRLVAETFLPNPENKPIVGHTKTTENGLEDKTANEAWNIAWMTQKENLNYGTLTLRLSKRMKGKNNPMKRKDISSKVAEKQKEIAKKRFDESPQKFLETINKNRTEADKKRKIKVNQYNKITGEFIRTWDSAADIEKELKICHSNVTACCKGKIISAGGYKWKYYESRTD